MTQAPPARPGVRLPRQLRRGGEDGRAGASARRKYRQMRASWRRRTRRRLAVFFGGYLTLVLVPAHVLVATTGSAMAVYAAGVLFGVGLTLLIAARDMAPAHVAQWELGAWAEQWTATELRPLRRRGWTVLHDRLLHPDRPGNVDHVLVGPPGVYVLDSKRWPGTVHVDPTTGQVTVTNPDASDLRPTTRGGVAGAARALSAEVSTQLRRALGRGPWVQAVVVIWGDFPQQHLEVDRVVYVAGNHLRDWILAQPPRTQRTHPDQVAAALRQALPAA